MTRIVGQNEQVAERISGRADRHAFRDAKLPVDLYLLVLGAERKLDDRGVAAVDQVYTRTRLGLGIDIDVLQAAHLLKEVTHTIVVIVIVVDVVVAATVRSARFAGRIADQFRVQLPLVRTVVAVRVEEANAVKAIQHNAYIGAHGQAVMCRNDERVEVNNAYQIQVLVVYSHLLARPLADVDQIVVTGYGRWVEVDVFDTHCLFDAETCFIRLVRTRRCLRR